MKAGVSTGSKTPSRHAGGAVGATPSRPAPLVHKGPKGKMQGYRFPGRDYRQPAFYMITMTAHDRRPWFASCADNRSTLTEDGHLVYARWQRIARDYPQCGASLATYFDGSAPKLANRDARMRPQWRCARLALHLAGRKGHRPRCVGCRRLSHPHETRRLPSYLQAPRQNLRPVCPGPAPYPRLPSTRIRQQPVTRDLCLAMNRWCRHIAKARHPMTIKDKASCVSA